MKITYIGGGSLRNIAELREIFTRPEMMQGGEIALYDRSRARSEAVATLVRQAPEFEASGTTITCPEALDDALAGADFVLVTVGPWGWDTFARSEELCVAHGLLGTDNLSANGPFLALRGGPLVLDLARRMETLAPQGVMLIFTNPIATLAAVVNRATTIKAVGICAGQSNHCYDLSRMMGWDKMCFDFNVEVAGTNHMSWIKTLRLDGEDFFPKLDAKLAEGIHYDRLSGDPLYGHFLYFFPKMVEAYQTFGALLFSSEPDGLPHLNYYAEAVARSQVHFAGRDMAQDLERSLSERRRGVAEFEALVSQPLPPGFWTGPGPDWRSLPDPRAAAAVQIMRGLSGTEPVETTGSYLNHGAVLGFPDDAVVEYTMRLENGRITPKASHTLPPAAVGVTQALIESQTLVAEAIIHEDRRRFVQGFYAYPLCRDRNTVEPLITGLVDINRAELPSWVV